VICSARHGGSSRRRPLERGRRKAARSMLHGQQERQGDLVHREIAVTVSNDRQRNKTVIATWLSGSYLRFYLDLSASYLRLSASRPSICVHLRY
jgi:hypothetical protein